MSDEFFQLKKKRLELKKQLELIEEKIKQLEKIERTIDLPIKCPQCGSTDWYVRANYNPFKKKAYEDRKIKITCKKCGFSKIEHVVTETN